MLPLSSCRYFWFPLPRQSNLSAHIQLFCCSGHINIGFLVFRCLQGSGGRMKGGRNSGEEGNSACLCPWVITEVRRRNCCVLRTAAQAPGVAALLCPSCSNSFLCSACRSLWGWTHSRQPIIVFSWVQIVSLTIRIFT